MLLLLIFYHKNDFFTDLQNVDFADYEPHCIASVLKKFLRELPDPIIPVQWYDRFLEASRKCHSSCNYISRIFNITQSLFIFDFLTL